MTGDPPGSGLTDLPSLADLPLPDREASILGPGWYEFDPLSLAHKVLSFRVAITAGNGLRVTGGNPVGYGVFGTRGFDGDKYPTSARITLDAITGEYYVAFADFAAGSWVHTGPYSGSAQAEIPGLNPHTSRTAFVSPTGVCYFAVIVPDGSEIEIGTLAQGVHGGSGAPSAPFLLEGIGGDNGYLLTWKHSPDCMDPDFAGYVLQRAELLTGDFAEIGAAPLTEPHFLDTTALVDHQYRYRVAALDVSGNQSPWSATEILGPVSGELAEPVAILDMPDGPFWGPIALTFDLSRSYDPESPPGTPMDNYEISLSYGPLPVSGPDPVKVVTLQPGSYMVQGRVEIGGLTGRVTEWINIYPRWQADSVVVHEPDAAGSLSRMEMLRAVRNPNTGLINLFGYDPTIPAVAIRRENAGGGYDLFTLPAYGKPSGGGIPVDHIGAPVPFGEGAAAPVVTDDDFLLAWLDGDEPRMIPIDEREENAWIATATDGQEIIWFFYDRSGAGTLPLVITSTDHLGITTEVIADLGNDLEYIDAVYDPGTEMITVVYCWTDGGGDHLGWFRWDPALAACDVAPTEIAPIWAPLIDVELNPVTGRPGMIYYSAAEECYRYCELDGADNWLPFPGEIIDNSMVNSPIGDMVYGDTGPYASFALVGPGSHQAYMYERTAPATWTLRNTIAYTDDSGYYGGLISTPGSTDVIAADLAADLGITVLTFHDDGTETVNWTLPGSSGQGYEMHGCAGSDGLHVIWRNWNDGIARHYTSPDHGATWVDSGEELGHFALDLTVNGIGDVYYSYVSGANAMLDYWDGAAWVNRSTQPGDFHYRPFFSHHSLSDSVRWQAYDDLTTTKHYVYGSEGGAWADDAVVLTDGPVWTGVLNEFGWPGPVTGLVIAGAVEPYESSIGFYYGSADTMDVLISPVVPEPWFSFYAAEEVWGRTLSTCLYADKYTSMAEIGYWAAQGAWLSPVRYEVPFPFSGDPQLVTLDMSMDFFNVDCRRTISTGFTWGAGCAVLISNLGGTDLVFEWSNFGDWEELPFPENMDHMTMPELIIDRNGSWHIVYKNYLTDQVMCRSTL